MKHAFPKKRFLTRDEEMATKRNKNRMQQKRIDHTKHQRKMVADFKRRFLLSLLITVPILVLSPFVQSIFRYSFSFYGTEYASLLLASFIYLYGGWPFFRGLKDEIKNRMPGMMTLITVAITVAYAYSTAVTFGLEGVPFFWELATLIDIMLVGHWIEMRSVEGASGALEKLARLLPAVAHKKRGGEVDDVPLGQIKKGDRVLVKPGENIPCDGEVVGGESFVNQAMLTGEAEPVLKKKKDKVTGGSVNGAGSLLVKVENEGEDSYISKVIDMVKRAQASKSRTRALSDKAAYWLTVTAISVGIMTLCAWLIAGRGLEFSISRMVTVMVITCPHALGLAVPLVVAVSTTKSARNGLLIRNRTAFENSRKITAVVFDKTGTLTTGEFSVDGIKTLDKHYNAQDILTYAAAVESNSEHPLAKAVIKKARQGNMHVPDCKNFKAMKGKGVRADVHAHRVEVVSADHAKRKKLELPEKLLKNKDHTYLCVIIDHKLAGIMALSDEIRKESYRAVRMLKKRGIKCMLLSGDNQAATARVADELGVDGYFAEVLPEHKLDKVKELKAEGEYVAMTGDGINDSPALAEADVGIAVGSGTDIAAATADIILVNSNPLDVSSLILFGKATYRKMVQNLIWATGYNVAAIPLAAGVLFSFGIVLSPAVGALLMSLSTIIVAINARFLNIKK